MGESGPNALKNARSTMEFAKEPGMDDLAAARMKHGCVIMASGVGSRFGSNKLMAELAGKPLVSYAIRATDGPFAKRVVVTRHADVAKLCQAMGVAAVVHDEPLRSDAVRLGMRALEGCDTATFVQGDQPLIGRNSIEGLLRAAEREPEFIWRASFGGTPGAPVLFPSWTFGELRALPAGKGGGFVARAHEDRVRTVEVASPWELFDVDTRDDLRAIEAYLAQIGVH